MRRERRWSTAGRWARLTLYALGMAHAEAGHIEEARGMLAEPMEPASWTYVPAHAIADLYGALGASL